MHNAAYLEAGGFSFGLVKGLALLLRFCSSTCRSTPCNRAAPALTCFCNIIAGALHLAGSICARWSLSHYCCHGVHCGSLICCWHTIGSCAVYTALQLKGIPECLRFAQTFSSNYLHQLLHTLNSEADYPFARFS